MDHARWRKARRCSNKRKRGAILPEASRKRDTCGNIYRITNDSLRPWSAREKLKSVILDIEPERTLRLIATSMAGRAGANEIIREGLANEFLQDYAINKEMQLLEEVWARISSNGAVAYGQQDLARAMEEGAIETLLVAIDLLRDEKTEIDGVMLSTWIRGLDDIGAKLVQCSTEHDAGEQLMGLGGVVALLRYKMV